MTRRMTQIIRSRRLMIDSLLLLVLALAQINPALGHSIAQDSSQADRSESRSPAAASPADNAGDTSGSERALAGRIAYLPIVVRPHEVVEEVKSFPGAEGFGAQSVGGRGGRAIEVTNLNDSGPGSLRACVEAEGPRTCIFRVAGTITLEKRLVVKNPFLTIAGQTAPGDGILLRNAPHNTLPTLAVNETHDIVIQHLRLRPGPSTSPACCLRGLSILNSRRIMIDHVSISWATDVNLAVRQSQDVTVQWSIFSEPLNNSTHEKGAHAFAAEIAGTGTDRVSFHHNLIAHAQQRVPRLGAGLVDVRNNLIYNISNTATFATNGEEPVVRLNYIGNYFDTGPGNSIKYPVSFLDRGVGIANMGGYEANNIVNGTEQRAIEPDDEAFIVDTPYDVAPVTTDSPIDAYRRVLEGAGATLPARDSTDTRIVNEVVTRSGRIIDHPDEVGGWPHLASGTPPADSDHDGMPDTWETSHGLDPNDPTDGPKDSDGDGYTNLEEFLNGTNPSGR